jgi:hypothetical protein
MDWPRVGEPVGVSSGLSDLGDKQVHCHSPAGYAAIVSPPLGLIAP